MVTRLVHAAFALIICVSPALAADAATTTTTTTTTAPATTQSSPWPAIGSNQKPWVRWWWPGSAVDKENLARELDEFAAAGFGGVEVTPIYGVNGAESREIDFLSPKWMEMLAFAATQAKRHGMQFDMATGTGWPFGGPWIRADDADAVVARDGRSLISKPTNMKVKRAAPGDAGLVVNPYSAAAMKAYLAPFDAPFKNFPRDLIRCQFHDSFEYSGNWTADLPDRFLKMHGYDLRDHAAELFGEGDQEQVRRVKCDYRETLAQLHLEYIRAWVDWSHQHGWLARNQAHGAPGNLLDLYAAADIPETETFGSTPFAIPGFRREEQDVAGDAPQPLIARFASSAAHVTGKNLVGCETFTWLREHFRSSLAMMKPEADQMFLAGVNAMTYHGSCYSPADAQWPGWQFYASVSFSPTNTIWHDLPVLNAYIARVQSVLQAGKPDNDLLLYFPVYDFYSDPKGMEVRFRVHDTKTLLKSFFGQVAQDLVTRGYSFDLVSDDQIRQLRPGKDHALVAPGGGTYRALIVPICSYIPKDTAAQVDKLQRQGAQVSFPHSGLSDGPVLADPDSRQTKLHFVENGQVSITGPALAVARSSGARREPLADDHVGVIRRAWEGGSLYFIANLTSVPVDGWKALGVNAAGVAILDPRTGDAALARIRWNRGVTEIYLQLQAGQSLILKTYEHEKPPLPDRLYTRAIATQVVTLKGPWDVTFTAGGPALPPPLKLDKLVSWTDAGGDEAKNFAGTARYRIEFDAPAVPDATEWLLDLGDVRESARVTLNGQSVGTLWSLPLRVLVGRYLKPGRNVLELNVTNLAANRIRDLDRRGVKWKIMKEINFVDIHYKKFDASGWDVTPSGLLGPVTLVPLKVVH